MFPVQRPIPAHSHRALFSTRLHLVTAEAKEHFSESFAEFDACEAVRVKISAKHEKKKQRDHVYEGKNETTAARGLGSPTSPYYHRDGDNWKCAYQKRQRNAHKKNHQTRVSLLFFASIVFVLRRKVYSVYAPHSLSVTYNYERIKYQHC